MENPSYTNALLCWKHYAIRMVGVPIDENGLRTDLLEETILRLKRDGTRVKLVYIVTPGHNPSGVTLGRERGKHLLELASRYDFLVFEDVAYLPLQYKSGTGALVSMDTDERVIHESTASKIMGTGWRMRWLIAKEQIFDKCLQAKMPMDMCAPSPSQLLFQKLQEQEQISVIIKMACKVYREKRDLMIESIEDHLPYLRFTRPIAGCS